MSVEPAPCDPAKGYFAGTVDEPGKAGVRAVDAARIYADFAQSLIGIARRLYVNEPFGADLRNTVYALDASTIDLCLSVFPWAPFQSTKAAVKLHTLLDLRGNIPTFIHISDGKFHEFNVLDQLVPEAGAFYIMDRGFLDFARLYRFHQAGSFFVTRDSPKTRRFRMRHLRLDTANARARAAREIARRREPV